MSNDNNVLCWYIVERGCLHLEARQSQLNVVLGCRLVKAQWQGAWLVFRRQVPCGILPNTPAALLCPLSELVPFLVKQPDEGFGNFARSQKVTSTLPKVG